MSKPNQNILRRHRSLKPLIITFAIMLVMLFFLVSVGIYAVLDYAYVHHITTMSFEQYFLALASMTSLKHTLPINAVTVQNILVQQLNLWWIYIGAVLLMFIFLTSRNRNDFKGMEHGSAAWANKSVIKEFQEKSNAIPVAKDCYVPIDFSKTDNLNEIVIGGSGAGKTFRKIKPDILQLNGSYVITDPKGELYRDCAKMLFGAGYKIRVLNLKDLHYSNAYNPFAYLMSEQDVISLSDLFMKNTKGEGEKEDFWSGAAHKTLTMLMVYLYKSETEIKSFGRIVRLLNSIRYSDNQIDMSCEFSRCLNKHAAQHPNDVATITWNGQQGLPQETMASITEVLSTRLALFSTTDLDAITTADEMDFDRIGIEKTAVFLIIPAARNTYKAISNIFYSQLFERLMRVADAKYNGCLPLLVSCELDEFANIGEIPAFNETLSVVRSYNIRICIILQGLSQLKAVYEKTYESIIGNCDIFTLLGSKDNDTLKYVSEKLDKITVRGDSRSFNRGSQGGGQDTEAYTERFLLYPNEIKKALKPKGKNRKYGGACIVFIGLEDPFYLPKYDTVNHPMFAQCGSKYKKYVHNNTDIQVVYQPLWDKRLKDYEDMYNKYFEREKSEAIEYKKEELIMQKEEQKQLEEEFNRNNYTIALPDIDEPTEKEYSELCLSYDVAEYKPVSDFADDYDESLIFDDIAPIVTDLQGGDRV